jgi:asparagine synthase (glutamine-hydrolysing)
MKVLNEKYILKRATTDLIPAFLHNRPKQPYRSTDIPCFFDARTRRTRFDYVADALSGSAIHTNGVFKADAVTRLVARAHSGQELSVRDGMAIVSVLSTHLLVKQFSDRLGRVA